MTVIEDVGGTIEAWHGNCLLKEFSTFTSVEAAIEEAKDDAERYSVDAFSSLRFRVREAISHTHIQGTVDNRHRSGKTLIHPYKVLERHVLDVISGPIEHAVLTVNWVSGAVIAFPASARNPGDDLVNFIAPYAISGYGNQFLYDGYGYSNFELKDVSLAPYVKGSCNRKDSEREIERCPSAVRMTFNGKQDILVPKGASAEQVLEKLEDEGLDIACSFDFARCDGIARSWHLFVGDPVATMAFSLPPAAAAGPK
ncbi:MULTISPECIES: hypothetical protein [unclassified Bradyrhizobium]